MNLKKLTQAVFEGLPPEYRWAAVDADGDIVVADHEHFFWHESKKWLFPSDSTIKIIVKTIGYDASDWQHSLIERQDAPTAADIDWSRQDAPEGATHYKPEGKLFFYKNDRGLRYWSEARERWIESNEPDSLTSRISELVEIRKPEPQIESIHDVARSIEAARVAEQSERTYPHYFKDVSDVDAIDLYHVARLYDITDPALFHAFKKIACAGKRGAKDQAQDVQEAIDALKRWQELNV